MTAVDLDALDAARAAATPGPWQTYWGTRIGSGVVPTTPSGSGVTMDYYIGEIADEDDRADTDNEPNPGSPTADAALIVAMHGALPDLIAEARRYRALREAVEGLAERWAKMADETPNAWDRVTIRSHTDHLRAALAAVDGGGTL